MKSKLNYYDQSERMQSIMKSRQDNVVISCTSVISIKYDAKLSRPIKQCAVHDKDETGQWHDERTCPLNSKNETKVSCSIRQDMVYDED